MLRTPFRLLTGSCLLGLVLLLLAWARTDWCCCCCCCCWTAAWTLALFFAGLATALALSAMSTASFSLLPSSSTLRSVAAASLSRLRFLLLSPCGTGGSRAGSGVDDAPPVGCATRMKEVDGPRDPRGLVFSGVVRV